jgi:hypothetical protein
MICKHCNPFIRFFCIVSCKKLDEELKLIDRKIEKSKNNQMIWIEESKAIKKKSFKKLAKKLNNNIIKKR